MSYTNLARMGWPVGVHKAPHGYQHPWLVVTDSETAGFYSREAARLAWRNVKAGQPLDQQLDA